MVRAPRSDPTKLSDVDRNAFYDSSFMAIEPNPLNGSALTLGTLTNAIHPLFVESQWSNLPTNRAQGWSVIENSCRLASKFLESRALVPVWDTLLNKTAVEKAQEVPTCVRQTRSNAVTSYQYRAKDVNSHRKIDARVVKRNRNRLRNLTNRIKFELTETEGYCDGAATQPGEFSDPARPESKDSVIGIGINDFNRLLKAQTSQDLPQLLWYSFDLAVNLVHELAHALRKLVDGVSDLEPYWGDDPIGELGFQVEKALFGGCIANIFDGHKGLKLHRRSATKASNLQGMIVLWRWPCQAIAEHYTHNSYPINVSKEPKETHEYDLAWRVDVAWLQRFFTDAFWNDLGSYDNLAHLRPPKEVGYNFSIQRKKRFGEPVKVPARAPGDDWRYFALHAHERLDDGCIVRRGLVRSPEVTSRIMGRPHRITKSYRK